MTDIAQAGRRGGIGALMLDAAARFSVSAAALRDFLAAKDNPLLRRELEQRPEVREMAFRPYVNCRWSLRQRIGAIADHYALVAAKLPLFDLAPDHFRDAAVFDVDGMTLRVVIDRPRWMLREGEVAVSLFCGIDRIYTAIVTVAGTPERMSLIVGNLQGDGRDRNELYKRLTKGTYGMRTRDFMVRVVQMLAEELGMAEVLGVADAAHRSSFWLTRARKLSVYDQIWTEHDGVLDDATGFFRLPAHVEPRAEGDIPARKRSQYRQRHSFLADLQSRIRAGAASPGPVTKRESRSMSKV